MGATAKKTDEEIVAASREYNRGDVALGRKPNEQRSPKQRFALRANIEPGELINRDNPNHNYQFTWVPYADVHYFHDMKDEGYKVVTEAEWIETRGTREWYMPEKDKWRWAETKMLVNRDEFLMYRDEDRWKQEQLNRLNLNQGQSQAFHEGQLERAARAAGNAGIEVEIEANGKPNIAGVRRTYVT